MAITCCSPRPTLDADRVNYAIDEARADIARARLVAMKPPEPHSQEALVDSVIKFGAVALIAIISGGGMFVLLHFIIKFW